MFKMLFEKNYNTHNIAILHMNACYVQRSTYYSSKLRLVKSLCQKYTATLGCHSTFA